MTRRDWLLVLLGALIGAAWFIWQGYVYVVAPQAFDRGAL